MSEETLLALSKLGERLAARGDHDDACTVGAVLLGVEGPGWVIVELLLREAHNLLELAAAAMPPDVQFNKDLRRLRNAANVLSHAAIQESRKSRVSR